jgi:cytochrome d ubiquinol oxidase subunit II
MNPEMLPIIWFSILCLEIGLYILLDGADLGLGMLSLLPQEQEKRSLIIKTLGPIWDANETWLVIAGGTLFGAFPLVYSVVLNALYVPVMLILFGLIIRAVSFEFREYSDKKRFWEVAFGIGSLLAVLGQGFAAGGILSGIHITNGQFSGGTFDWVTPLTLFMTVGVAMSYAVVGYAYLIKKTDYELKNQSFFRVIVAGGLSFAGFFAATLLLPQLQQLLLERWTTPPSNYLLCIITGLIALIAAFLIYDVLKKRHEEYVHTLCMCIFVLSFIGMLVGIYPYIIPPSVSIFDAAASPATLQFMLWGIGPLLPIVLAYNWYMYRVFRRNLGHEGHDEGY